MLKNKLNKRTSLNLGAILCVIVAVYFISYLLLYVQVFPLSIGAMLSYLNHSVHHWHVLAVGLLPVYVALMIFGTAVVGIYLGSAIHRVVVNFFHK